MRRDRLVTVLLAAVAAPAGFAPLTVPAAASGGQHRAPIRRSRPQISGLAQVGHVLQAHHGRWSGASVFAYRWQRCNARGAHCTQLVARRHRPHSRSTYTTGKSDLGQRMRVIVVARNRWGTRTASSRLTARIRSAGPAGHKRSSGGGSSTGTGSGANGSGGGGNGGSGGGGNGGSGGGGGGGGGVTPSTGQSVAFWLAWDGSMSPSQIPWNAVTQVDLFALQTTAGSGLDTSLISSVNSVPQWVATVHQHKRLAIITVGGISDQHWDTACNDTNRSGFVSNLIKYMVSNGFDGVDIDIEQTNWGSQQAPVAAWDTCVQAIAQAAHAATTAAGAKPIVSTDVDQTWMDPYVAGFASYPDQFNLMGYTNNCNNSCMAAQVQDLLSTGKVSSAAKMTMGVDVDAGDTGQTVTPAQCGSIAQYASTAGLGGVMLWTVQGDGASHPCLNQIAPTVEPAP